MVWPCWTGPVSPAGVCVSPGARRSWLIPMTASSPTPQQQNRWKGRRVLAVALIPQPDAYPPEHTHAHTHTPAALLYTLMSVVKKTPTQHLRTHHRRKQRLVCQVVSREGGCKKNSRATPGRSLNPGTRTQSWAAWLLGTCG